MKKIRILVILFILSFSFTVKAEVLLEIDCNNKTIDASNSITCEGNFVYEDVIINDIEMEYETNLNINFKEVSDFKLTKNGNKINIHPSSPLEGIIIDSRVIFQVILSGNDNLNENEKLTFKNIKINNSSSFEIEDVSEMFSVTKIEKILDNTNTLEKITINTEKIDSSNPLNSFTIYDKEIVGFDKNKLEYDIKVDKEIVRVKALGTSTKSSIENLGDFRVSNQETITREIKVKAENGDIRVYKLNITNTSPIEKEELSKDNTLKIVELLFNKEHIAFDFDSKIDNYDIKVTGDVDKLKIKAETNDSKAHFDKKYGPRDIKLAYGNNKVVLKVYSEEGFSKVYTFNINRLDERDSDNALNFLKINGKEIILGDKSDYEISLSNDISKTEIEAVANSSKANVNYEDIDLSDGENNVTVSVTAENGEEKEYHINVIREEANEETKIFEKFEITGYNIDFSKDVHSYNIKINDKTDELDIKIVPSNISFEILNNKELHHGSKVIVKINDDNGEYEYTINIEKDSLLINIICYGVFIVGLISFIMSCKSIIKKRKKKI